MPRVLVVGSSQQAADALRSVFEGCQVEGVPDLSVALTRPNTPPTEFLYVDLDAIAADAADVADYRTIRKALYPVWRAFPGVQVVVMTDTARIRGAVQAVRAGATDYLTYPLMPDEIRLVHESVQREVQTQLELDYLRQGFWGVDADQVLRTRSPAMQEVYEKVRKVSPTPSTVLLTGETGTGKNVLASMIHRHSDRADGPLIGVHCGAIPETLLESELFGHEKGAFTGAVRRKLGKFELAQGGTLLLDEVGTISPAMQVKLLQVLQDRTVQRVGGERAIEVDVRILAATNADLGEALQDGSFRRDLYFRLNVFGIEIPPLRERRADLPLLVEHFVERFNGHFGRSVEGVHELVMEAFQRYDWPGNVRELEGLIERAFILEDSPMLSPESFPDELFSDSDHFEAVPIETDLPLSEARRRAVADIERVYLKQLLEQHQGRIGEAARAAGITDRQLRNLMSRHGLHKEDFRPARRGR